MSKRRYINTKFWSDTYIADLDPIEKLLFIYFISNEKTNIAGIYELPLKYMAVDTGIDKEMIEKILKRFSKDGKIFYIDGWVYVKNFKKHQNLNNVKIQKGIKAVLSDVPKNIQNKVRDIDESYIGHTSPSNNTDSDLDLDNNSYTPKNSSVEVEEEEEEPTQKPSDLNREFFERGAIYHDYKDHLIELGMQPPAVDEMLTDFIAYWTEPNKSGTKVKWEIEKTFDVKRRLRTWLKNNQRFSKDKNKPKGITA